MPPAPLQVTLLQQRQTGLLMAAALSCSCTGAQALPCQAVQVNTPLHPLAEMQQMLQGTQPRTHETGQTAASMAALADALRSSPLRCITALKAGSAASHLKCMMTGTLKGSVMLDGTHYQTHTRQVTDQGRHPILTAGKTVVPMINMISITITETAGQCHPAEIPGSPAA